MASLADPAKWIVPCLRQAVADLKVAQHLLGQPLDDAVHLGRPAYHAAAAKLQQALEKGLKAVILEFLPTLSDLVVSRHRILSDLGDVMSRADRKRFAKAMRELRLHPVVRSRLKEIERYVPMPSSAVIDADSGGIVGLPFNAEYPFTDVEGRAVAPCDAFPIEHAAMLRDAKAAMAFFRGLTQIREFSSSLPSLD
jgi:HEPN domain-containing protein